MPPLSWITSRLGSIRRLLRSSWRGWWSTEPSKMMVLTLCDGQIELSSDCVKSLVTTTRMIRTRFNYRRTFRCILSSCII
ncbi:hypothetical protein WDU94_013939 [Cyamophila willieti]